MLFFAIGAVVDGVPTTSQTPLSGQVCPVRAVAATSAISWNFLEEATSHALGADAATPTALGHFATAVMQYLFAA